MKGSVNFTNFSIGILNDRQNVVRSCVRCPTLLWIFSVECEQFVVRSRAVVAPKARYIVKGSTHPSCEKDRSSRRRLAFPFATQVKPTSGSRSCGRWYLDSKMKCQYVVRSCVRCPILLPTLSVDCEQFVVRSRAVVAPKARYIVKGSTHPSCNKDRSSRRRLAFPFATLSQTDIGDPQLRTLVRCFENERTICRPQLRSVSDIATDTFRGL